MRESSHAAPPSTTAAAASVTARADRSPLGHPRQSSRTRGGPRGDRPGAVDELWCLGDVVGYGPRPNECVDLIRERASLSLCGNHDLAVARHARHRRVQRRRGRRPVWTQRRSRRRRSGRGSRARSPSATRDGAELFHGSPRDPVWDYVLSEGGRPREPASATTAPLVLVGHSHVALALALGRRAIDRRPRARPGPTAELAGRPLAAQPGLGRPAARRRRARGLALIDTDERGQSFRRVAYPIEADPGRDQRTRASRDARRPGSPTGSDVRARWRSAHCPASSPRPRRRRRFTPRARTTTPPG